MVLCRDIIEVFWPASRGSASETACWKVGDKGKQSIRGSYYFSTHGTGLLGSFVFEVEGTAELWAAAAAARRAATSKKEAIVRNWKDQKMEDGIFAIRCQQVRADRIVGDRNGLGKRVAVHQIRWFSRVWLR